MNILNIVFFFTAIAESLWKCRGAVLLISRVIRDGERFVRGFNEVYLKIFKEAMPSGASATPNKIPFAPGVP